MNRLLYCSSETYNKNKRDFEKHVLLLFRTEKIETSIEADLFSFLRQLNARTTSYSFFSASCNQFQTLLSCFREDRPSIEGALFFVSATA